MIVVKNAKDTTVSIISSGPKQNYGQLVGENNIYVSTF